MDNRQDAKDCVEPWASTELILNELFGIENLEQHAISLALAQNVVQKQNDKGYSLTQRLKDNEAALLKAYKTICIAVKADRAITPAAEWLLDNYHIVEAQILDIHNDLPPSYYRQLPKLSDGHLAGYPRVIGIAWAFIAHTDSLFDPDILCRFVASYQTVHPLTMGELWAIAISLRILLIENLRRASEYIVESRIASQDADTIADLLLIDTKDSIKAANKIFRQYEVLPTSRAFLVQLIQRMRDQDPETSPAQKWLEVQLLKQQANVEELVRDEHQKQCVTNVTVRNIITSMRLISQVDWTEIFERVSLVDDLLKSQSDFLSMDFPTRNLYRAAIEDLAKGSNSTEMEVTQVALSLSKQSSEPRESDPGYWLISNGRRSLESRIGYHASLNIWPKRLMSDIGISGYIASVLLLSGVELLIPLQAIKAAGLNEWILALMALVGLSPAMDLAVALVNKGMTLGIGATILPGLELSEGVPNHLSTMVVIPTLLTTLAELDEQVERLEIHYLASQDGALYFALLTDWKDAETESIEGDNAILNAAIERIEKLNAHYGPGPENNCERFLLLHRRRVWNDSQKHWMGWERKRGKLHELNQLLRGCTTTTYISTNGKPVHVPDNIRYVITLDSDTKLPLGTVRRLIGKMAHPLNHPRLDVTSHRVVEGYAILQPRVTPSLLTQRENSLFQRVFSSTGGIEPYAAAISDVYQDLFGEGSYAGKGIYDVDAFEASLKDRTPDNTLLSHDLFEGIFAHAGLVSDIEVIEEFPSRYDIASLRQHRWARGDWQLLPWLIWKKSKAVPLIGQWKMLDNLRRTLSAPVSIFILISGFLLPPQAAIVWTGFILSTILLPPLLPVFSVLLPSKSRVTLLSHVRALGEDIWLTIVQTWLIITFQAHQAWLMLDAILRTLYRLTISHYNMLEWVTAAQSKLNPRLDLLGFYKQMFGSIIIAAITLLVVSVPGKHAYILAAPFITLWLIAPAIARFISLSPAETNDFKLLISDEKILRQVARRTWRFFETFVTSVDNMLPPDNFQEDPYPVIAHRTSPTNLGLYLLSVVCANDMGWIGRYSAVERLEETLTTMGAMSRFRGHFYNWYDTQDLRPLEPQYVSSVDSGNLAGHLITLANVCREWVANPQTDSQAVFKGFFDEMTLMKEALKRVERTKLSMRREFFELARTVQEIEVLLLELNTNILSVSSLAALKFKAVLLHDIAQTISGENNSDLCNEVLFWAESILRSIESHLYDLENIQNLPTLISRLNAIAETVTSMMHEMEFEFLLDTDRKLLSIGYLVHEDRLDKSCYDLLASEARLASLIAIAKGDIPAKHWFKLGRSVTPIGFGAALISWSGSMFEYLMPTLVIQSPLGSLLEQTNRHIVERQISYADALGLPWGISESAYNVRDKELTYQYSNFGVPGLGLKRGLGENKVIAPYATALASMVQPIAATRNFEKLMQHNALSRYGFYEALDYTPSRLPEGESVAIVRAFMAHHQGMSVVAITNTLLEGIMRTRFHSEPIIQAAEILLQERMPRDISVAYPRAEEVAKVHEPVTALVRQIYSANYATPEAHILSNGSYQVMLTSAGSGYSSWNNIAITRWQEDVTRDDNGSYIFLRDKQSGNVWSAGYQPCGVEPKYYEVNFMEDRAEFIRRDGSLTTTTDIMVSAEDNAEVRRLTIVNTGNRVREIEVTSYSEIVLAPPVSDAAHPAFSKLFVQTSYHPKLKALFATRRRRTQHEPEVWAAHLVVVEGETIGEIEIETSRARFIRRGCSIRNPFSVTEGLPLSNTVGTVLDPIFSIRRCVSIPPGASVKIAFWTVAASSHNEVLELVDKHHDSHAFQRANTLAWTQAQVQLRHLGIEHDEASLFQRLGSHVLYTDPLMRPGADVLRRGTAGQSALWSQGISGDLPIILVRIDTIENIGLIRQLLRAHEYLQLKHLVFDLVILNEHATSYVQDLQVDLEAMVRANQSRYKSDDANNRSVFVLRRDLISNETAALLPAIARVVLDGRRGSLAKQLNRIREIMPVVPLSRKRLPVAEVPKTNFIAPELQFFNGLGGFSLDGKEYVTILGPGQYTPAPWINVIANPSFGFQVAAEGSGYTWSLNSRENQLTPWSNDPVCDRPGEVLYVRDEDTGKIWSPTASPIRNNNETYIARHGQGYSQFEHTTNGIELDLLQYVPLEDPVKISRLMIRNRSGRTRRLSVTAYVDWVLGQNRNKTAPYVMTELDSETSALFASNAWSPEFASRKAFMDLSGIQKSWTGDRREFLGRHGSLDSPLGLLTKAALSKRVGAGLDPCGVLQTGSIELKPNESIEVVFLLGQSENGTEAKALINKYRSINLNDVFKMVVRHWDESLDTIQVTTPDKSMDIMLNRWLLYQTLVCRIWARSAFYQASGAYGFRDQLQDGMALAVSNPSITREHLLRAASRQFVEGDVQHWWLPLSGQGVRTRISDDRIWLAYATAHYINVTGDKSILDEPVYFLEGRALIDGEHDAFYHPTQSHEPATLFEHCARGLDQSLKVGQHGLPLIGTGDWNDGMNQVGEAGHGESVWLAWFLHKTLCSFIPIAKARRSIKRTAMWMTHVDSLKQAIENNAWDGAWYRRGYFDDGTPLGSSLSEECRIDSIAQSWSVISGAANIERAKQSMDSVEEYLIHKSDRLALLFTPPFDKTDLEPGYIKGYPPGIRENGGQYSHAATWSVIALAMLGEGAKATHLFSLLNPINHASTRANVRRYKVEPYVMAADIYSVYPHVGHGGWTWYTGAAGWMYRAGVESILGFQLQGEHLLINPCISEKWPGYEIIFKYHGARYEISVQNPNNVSRGILLATINDKELSGDFKEGVRIKLEEAGLQKVTITLG